MRQSSFAPLSARRLLVLGGIALILIGMLFGDIFAVFVLHQNASRVGASLASAAHAALAGNTSLVDASFQDVASFLENRGTKVDTHVHMIDFGYLAFLLAILLPWIAFSEAAKQRLAWLFLIGAGLLPVGVFLIHYVGLAYSPLHSIGWASIVADLGGLLVLLATLGFLLGLAKYFRSQVPLGVQDELLLDRGRPRRILLAGGLVMVLAGFLHGAYYAGVDLYRHEALDSSILTDMATGAAANDARVVDRSLEAYGQLQGDKAVKIAAHAHIIEFGLLAMLLAFFQPYVSLRETWKLRWACVLIIGSVLLPVCVLMELRFGLLAGGLADFGGLLVIIALLAIWIGILRYTGQLDAQTGDSRIGDTRIGDTRIGDRHTLSSGRRLLILGGIALALWGMGYGLWYAVFAEHQALNNIASSLASAFDAAARRNPAAAETAFSNYREAKYIYDRQVDVHGHWIGLAMLLIVIGIGFDRVGFNERRKTALALALFAGAIIFPFGVLLQTVNHGPIPRGVAILGSALVVVALGGIILGLAVRQTSAD
jgi:hypothetical protein